MRTKLKTLAFLLLLFCITISCNNRTKQIKNSNEVTQINEEDMEKNSNCVVINDISFDGKEKFFKYIEKERISFYEAGNNIGLIIQYTGETVPFVFPILSYWLNQKGYKAVSSEVFNDKLKSIFKIDTSSSKYDNIFFSKDYLSYGKYPYQMNGDEGDLMSEEEFVFSTKYKLFFRPFFNGELVTEIDQTQRYQTCFPERLFHYNNYLFNDDKNSLKWLKKNDMEFLELLDSEFGYSLWKADR